MTAKLGGLSDREKAVVETKFDDQRYFIITTIFVCLI